MSSTLGGTTREKKGPPTSERFGRLTYTSFEGPEGGGWQVKEAYGLSPSEANALCERIRTTLDAGTELPRFPSPGEVSQFPRRMLYAPVAGGRAWWHAAHAGNDAAGRPGNIFADVVLERLPVTRDQRRRPVALWRSSDWLVPHGADAVRAATIPVVDKLRDGSLVTSDNVVDFLLDLAHYRHPLLSVLLDCTAEAIRGGRQVVLGVESTDSAALWLGAVSYLMTGHAARSLYFSTLERVSRAHLAVDPGIHVTCVPSGDLEGVGAHPDLVVLDENDEVDVGDLEGNPHVTQRGDEVVATEWSVLAKVVLLDQATSLAAMDLLDQTADELGEVETAPAVGLALVVARRPDEFHDARAEAARVLVRTDLDLSGDLRQAVRQLLSSEYGASASTAWQQLEHALQDAEGTLPSALIDLCVRLAVTEPGWLSQAGGIPLWAPLEQLPDSVVAELAPLVRHALETLADTERSPGSGQEASVVANLANLVGRLDLEDPVLADVLQTELERHVGPIILGDGSEEFVRLLGPYAEKTQDRFLRPLVERDPQLQTASPGWTVPPDVLSWLYPHGAPPVELAGLEDLQTPRVRAELSLQRVFSGDQSVAERPYAVWATLVDAEQAGYLPDLASIFGGQPWAAADLLKLRRRFGSAMKASLLEPTIKTARMSRALRELCLELLQLPALSDVSTAPEGPLGLAALRAYEGEEWFSGNSAQLNEIVEWIVRGGCYATTVAGAFDEETLQHLRSAAVLAAVTGRHGAQVSRLGATLGHDRLLAPREVRMIDLGLTTLMSTPELALQTFFSTGRADELVSTNARLSWANTMHVAGDRETEPVLVQVIRKRLTDMESSFESLRTRMIDLGQPLASRRGSDPERQRRTLEKLINGWLREIAPSGRWTLLRRAPNS